MRTVFLLLFLTPSLFAQSPEIIYHSAADIAKIKAELLSEAHKASNGLASRIVDSQDNSSLLVIARTQTGEAEQHELWADQVIVQAGTMTVVTGGSMAGKHPFGTAPGEFRGSGLQGGAEHLLHQGDLLRIPAGVPHWAKLAPGQTVTYIAIKEKK